MAKKRKKAPATIHPPPPRPGQYMRPEWRKKVYGEGGRREAPPQTSEEARERSERAKREALPFWLRPFEYLRPAAEEAARRRKSRRPIEEVVVPESERGSVREEAERFRRGASPSGFRAERPIPPVPPVPPVRPGGRYQAPPPYGGSGRREAPRGAPGWDPLSTIDVDRVFEHVRTVRQDPRFQGIFGLTKISEPGRNDLERARDLLRAFRAPAELFGDVPDGELWTRVGEPLARDVARELNARKPADLPGTFKFDLAENGAYGLVYEERRP